MSTIVHDNYTPQQRAAIARIKAQFAPQVEALRQRYAAQLATLELARSLAKKAPLPLLMEVAA